MLQTSAINSQFWEVAKFSTDGTVMNCLTGEYIQHQSTPGWVDLCGGTPVDELKGHCAGYAEKEERK